MTSFLVLSEGLSSHTTPLSIDGWIVDWFNNGFSTTTGSDGMCILGNTVLLVLSLLLSAILGGFVGFQRESRGHNAGFRTHILMCVGSALIMVLSIYGIPGDWSRDPMRLAAAGVTGAGFVGAGAIIQNGFSVKGLTTATSIWITMAIGMACGAGYFLIAILCTVFAVITLSVLRKFEKFTTRKNPNFLVVCSAASPAVTIIYDCAKFFSLEVKNLDVSVVNKGDEKYLRISFSIPNYQNKSLDEFIERLKSELGSQEVSII